MDNYKSIFGGCRITAITPAFQAGDVGSTPISRFILKLRFKIKRLPTDTLLLKLRIFSWLYVSKKIRDFIGCLSFGQPLNFRLLGAHNSAG